MLYPVYPHVYHMFLVKWVNNPPTFLVDTVSSAGPPTQDCHLSAMRPRSGMCCARLQEPKGWLDGLFTMAIKWLGNSK